MSSSVITVVLADDHTILRQGLRSLLEKEPQMSIVGEAQDGHEALRLVERCRPRVLVLDLMLPKVHGLEVLKQVTRDFSETKVIILSMQADEPYLMEALRHNAAGYILKDSTGSDLVHAIREALAGRRYLSPKMAELAMTGYVRHPGKTNMDIYETLTSRERMVLQLAAEGLSSTEIAEKLFISPRTSETHRANLMRKLSLTSQTDLVRFAIRKGIITP